MSRADELIIEGIERSQWAASMRGLTDVQKVHRIVTEAGADGITLSNLTYRTRKIGTVNRYLAIRELRETGKIVAEAVGKGAGETLVLKAAAPFVDRL